MSINSIGVASTAGTLGFTSTSVVSDPLPSLASSSPFSALPSPGVVISQHQMSPLPPMSGPAPHSSASFITLGSGGGLSPVAISEPTPAVPQAHMIANLRPPLPHMEQRFQRPPLPPHIMIPRTMPVPNIRFQHSPPLPGIMTHHRPPAFPNGSRSPNPNFNLVQFPQSRPSLHTSQHGLIPSPLPQVLVQPPQAELVASQQAKSKKRKAPSTASKAGECSTSTEGQVQPPRPKKKRPSHPKNSAPKKPAASVMKQQAEDAKYLRKYALLKRSIKALVYKNAALCDEVARLTQRIKTVTEERKMLLKRIFHHERLKQRKAQNAEKKLAQLNEDRLRAAAAQQEDDLPLNLVKIRLERLAASS